MVVPFSTVTDPAPEMTRGECVVRGGVELETMLPVPAPNTTEGVVSVPGAAAA